MQDFDENVGQIHPSTTPHFLKIILVSKAKTDIDKIKALQTNKKLNNSQMNNRITITNKSYQYKCSLNITYFFKLVL